MLIEDKLLVPVTRPINVISLIWQSLLLTLFNHCCVVGHILWLSISVIKLMSYFYQTIALLYVHLCDLHRGNIDKILDGLQMAKQQV